MCPLLKQVSFCELMHADAITTDELGVLLKTQWPKVI